MCARSLIGIWRVRNKTKKRFTWRRYNPYVQSRLDFWLISESVQSDIMENDIIPCVLSDHDYVTLHLQIKKQKIGPSYWKFNNSLLNNQEYVVTLNENFQEWVNEYVKKDDKKMLWDWLKFKIREFTIPFSKKKKCEKERKSEKLEEELKRICEIDQADMKEEHMSKKKEIEEELTIIYDYFADGAILRSRSTWYEKGEKAPILMS